MSWYDVLLARNMGGGGTVDPAVIAEAVTDWLEDNVDPDTGYVIDDTFTVENAAPDSKKTGEELNSLKSAISNTVYTTKSKNLFDPNAASIGKYLNLNGTIEDYASTAVSDFIPVEVSKYVTVSKNTSSGRAAAPTPSTSP